MLPWLICLILLAAVVALWVKTLLLRRAFDQIAQGLEERLGEDTNTLLSPHGIPTPDGWPPR